MIRSSSEGETGVAPLYLNVGFKIVEIIPDNVLFPIYDKDVTFIIDIAYITSGQPAIRTQDLRFSVRKGIRLPHRLL